MQAIVKHFLNYQFAYIFFSTALIFIIFAVVSKNKTVKPLLLATFSLFISFGFAELALSFKNKMRIYDLSHPKDTFSVGHLNTRSVREINVIDKNGQKRKYENRAPNNDETVIYDRIYNIYSNGFRYTKCNLKSNENYVFFGCSYTFGAGLNDEQTLPYYFSKLMNFEKNVLNCGVPGRSTNSAINILESGLIPAFTCENSKNQYFIYSLINDHIQRNFRISSYPKDNWLYKNRIWKMGGQPFGSVKRMFARSYIFNSVFDNIINEYNKEYYENYIIQSLNYMKEKAETRYKAKFIVVVWPQIEGSPLSFIGKIKKTNPDLIFLPEYFKDCGYMIKDDCHPNAKANEELAKIIMDYINNKESKN